MKMAAAPKPTAPSLGKALANIILAMHREGKLGQFAERLGAANRAEAAAITKVNP